MKLPFTAATLDNTTNNVSNTPFGAVPQLVLGMRPSRRIGLGLGFGFTRLSYQESNGCVGSGCTSSPTFTLAELSLAPQLTVDAFHSTDDKVELYLLGAPIFGLVLETGQSAQSDIGFQFALGANYALHPNFRIGLEVGPVGHFYNLAGGETLSTVSLYTALVGSFVYPR